jgi:fructose-1,6-bisphosphatase/inositol monophosphatase family enzyme
MPEDLVMDFSPNEELLFWNGKWYRLVKDSVKREEDGHLVRRVYREVDKGEYESRVKALAVKLVKVGDVKVEDIIYDAIKELPMDKVAEIEGALDEELKKEYRK